MFSRLREHGLVLVVVDQPASIGALWIAVARSMGLDVGYLPGLAMRRIAGLHPGEGKTDARDAYVISDPAHTMPHTLRRVGTDDETLAGLTVLAGYDDDLAARFTRLTNRLRDALLHIHPALERLLGKHLDRGGVLDLLAAASTPAALRTLGADGITAAMRARSPRLAKTLPEKILTALDAQTLVVPGTAEFGRVIAGVVVVRSALGAAGVGTSGRSRVRAARIREASSARWVCAAPVMVSSAVWAICGCGSGRSAHRSPRGSPSRLRAHP